MVTWYPAWVQPVLCPPLPCTIITWSHSVAVRNAHMGEDSIKQDGDHVFKIAADGDHVVITWPLTCWRLNASASHPKLKLAKWYHFERGLVKTRIVCRLALAF